MRLLRMGFSIVAVTALVAVAWASPAVARAAVPEAQRAAIWQHTCEKAEGAVSPQEALVCVHSGFPAWPDRALVSIQRMCEHPLGGAFEYRSVDTSEFAACFFN
jgi:hypothetical protein